MTAGKSGREVGTDNVERLREYLAELESKGVPLPTRGGEANLSAIALACGFNRQVLYVNEAARTLLAGAVAKAGLARDAAGGDDETDEKPVTRTDRRDRRIHKLEQENASLKAENAGLRERVRRLEHVEYIMMSGRRVAP